MILFKTKDSKSSHLNDNNDNNDIKDYTIYAELSNRQDQLDKDGKIKFKMPEGVILQRNANSRGCFFYCDTEEQYDEVKRVLYSLRVNCQ